MRRRPFSCPEQADARFAGYFFRLCIIRLTC